MEPFLKQYFEKVIVKTMTLTMMSCFIAGLTLFYFHTIAQEEMLSTEISSRSKAIGNSMARLFETSLNIGIPLDEMVEANDFLDNNLASNQKSSGELSYIAITDLEGNLLYQTTGFENSLRGAFRRFSLGSYEEEQNIKEFEISNKFLDIPLKIKNGPADSGYIHLGISKKVTKNKIDDIYYDILTILFVSMVIGFEFFIFIFRNKISRSFEELFDTMRRIAVHDYTRTSVQRTKDAVGELISKLNDLIIYTATTYKNIFLFVKQAKTNTKISMDQHLHIKETLMEVTDNKMFPTAEKPTQDIIAPVVINLRLPAFLLVLAETILVAILPAYAAQFYNPEWHIHIPYLLDTKLSLQFISSTPILIFMIFSGLSIPIANRISYAFGFQKTLLVGLSISACGYFLSCFTNGLLILLISRSITAFGYGVAYITCQNYIAAYSPPDSRISGYAIFAVAFGAAYICGAPVGSIMVENIGYGVTFAVAGITTLFCMLIVRNYIVDFSGYTLQKRRQTNLKPIALFKNYPLLFLVVLSGLPARMIFTALICFLYPLYLKYLGTSPASIGRVIMIYGIISFSCSPFAARIVERIKNPLIVLLISSLCIAFSLIMSAYNPTVLGASISIATYALGAVIHTCSIMAMLEKIADIENDNHTKGSVLSFYFIFERIGMISGPAITSIILTIYNSFETTLYIMGIGIFAFTVVFSVSLLFFSSYFNKSKVNDSNKLRA